MLRLFHSFTVEGINDKLAITNIQKSTVFSDTFRSDSVFQCLSIYIP